MIKNFFKIIAMICMACTVNSMTADEVGKNQEDTVKALVQGNTAFALDMYKALSHTEEGDFFFSPYSISTVLAMTSGGAVGDTLDEMMETLHLPFSCEELHPAFAGIASLIQRQSSSEIHGANSLWSQEGMPLLSSFVERACDCYGANAETLDFRGNPDAARVRINNWIADHTNDKIRDILSENDVGSSTRLVLANALYFKGAWFYPFNASRTVEAPFHVSPKKDIFVPMMRQVERLPYYKGDGYTVVALPYKEESRNVPGFSMLIVVPDEEYGLPLIEDSLTADAVIMSYEQMSSRKVDFAMPRFSMEKKVSLNDTLSAMGMKVAFTADADFSGINGIGELSIGSVIHDTFIAVDEDGTEAAAATAVAMNTTSYREPVLPIIVRADHPFMAFIVDEVTGTILFMGRVVHPNA